MSIKNLIKRLLPQPVYQFGVRCYTPVKCWIYQHLFDDYSQNGETIVLRNLAKAFDERTFVEIGANDGVTISTSYGLVLEGWRGWLVEANPATYAHLERHLSRFDSVKTFCFAATLRRERIKLYLGKDDPNGFYSTVATDDSDWFRQHRSDSFVEVDGIPLPDFLKDQDVPKRFGILLIDTEGMDLEVLQSMDFATYRPRLIVTEEYKPKTRQKHDLLSDAGYQLVTTVGANTIWRDESSVHHAS